MKMTSFDLLDCTAGYNGNFIEHDIWPKSSHKIMILENTLFELMYIKSVYNK